MDSLSFKTSIEIDGVRYAQNVLDTLENSCENLENFLQRPLVNVSRKKAIKLSSKQFVAEFESNSRKCSYFTLGGVLLARDGNTFSGCHVSRKE